MSGSPALYINEYTNGLTGHVDITLDSGNGDAITVGKNVYFNENPSDDNTYNFPGNLGGVYVENSYDQSPHTSTVIYLTTDQFNAESSFINNQLSTTSQGNGTYELFTDDCITWAQSAINAAGLSGSQYDISNYLTAPAAVQSYAGLLDYFKGGIFH